MASWVCQSRAPAFQLLGGDVKAAHLGLQALEQLQIAATVADGFEVLIEQGFAGAAAVAALGIGEQHSTHQASGLFWAEFVVALGAVEAEADQKEGRGQ